MLATNIRSGRAGLLCFTWVGEFGKDSIPWGGEKGGDEGDIGMNGSCSVSVGIYSGSLELNFLADLQKVWKYFWEQGSFIEQCSLPLNSLRGSPEENEDRRHKYQDHHHHNRHNIDLIWVDIVKDQRVSSVWIVQLIFFVRCAKEWCQFFACFFEDFEPNLGERKGQFVCKWGSSLR